METTGEKLYAINVEERLNSFEHKLMETADIWIKTKDRLTKTERINKEFENRLIESELRNKELENRLTECELRNNELWDLVKTNEMNKRQLELTFQITKDSFISELLDVKHRLTITENQLNLFKSASNINHTKTKKEQRCDKVTNDCKPRDVESHPTKPHYNKSRDLEPHDTEPRDIEPHNTEPSDVEQQYTEKESTIFKTINVDHKSINVKQNHFHNKANDTSSKTNEHKYSNKSNLDHITETPVLVNNDTRQMKRSLNVPRGDIFYATICH